MLSRVEPKIKPLPMKIKEALSSNQSADCLIYGIKGDGKSSGGIGLGMCIYPKLSVSDIVFSMEELLSRVIVAERGSVIIFDETGTQASGMSSRNFMGASNKDTVDVWQMIRTKRICVFCITLDAGRIDNRIRDTFRFHISPIKKLSNDDTKGNGMAIVCELREIIKAKSGEGEDTIFTLKPTKPDGVSWIVIPLPPASLIHEYEIKREKVLNGLLLESLNNQMLKRNMEQKKRGRPSKKKKEESE